MELLGCVSYFSLRNKWCVSTVPCVRERTLRSTIISESIRCLCSQPRVMVNNPTCYTRFLASVHVRHRGQTHLKVWRQGVQRVHRALVAGRLAVQVAAALLRPRLVIPAVAAPSRRRAVKVHLRGGDREAAERWEDGGGGRVCLFFCLFDFPKEKKTRTKTKSRKMKKKTQNTKENTKENPKEKMGEWKETGAQEMKRYRLESVRRLHDTPFLFCLQDKTEETGGIILGWLPMRSFQ